MPIMTAEPVEAAMVTVTVNTMETVEAESRAASLARPEN